MHVNIYHSKTSNFFQAFINYIKHNIRIAGFCIVALFPFGIMEVNAQAPVNDGACNAITLSLGFNSPFSNVNATAQTGEPAMPVGTCTTQGNWCSGEPAPQVQHSVWFKFTVPATGTGSYAFRVNGNTGTFDSQEALFYAATCADVTNGNAVRLGANDDSTGSLFNSYMPVYCLTPTLTYYLMVDGYGTTTSASFFVDVIELSDRNAIANAGPDQTICYSLFPAVPVNGSVLGVAGSTTWSTTGNGTFVNPSALSTFYIPGSADKTSGLVRLILSTNDPVGVCNISRDTLLLNIIADSVNAGADRTFCNGQQYIKMNGVANLFTSFQWTTLGDGVFNNRNTLSVNYFPGLNDRAGASFKMVLRGVSTQCFNTVYDTVEVFNVIGTIPVVNLGPDRVACYVDSILINPSALSGYSSLSWFKSGDGIFNSTTAASVYYTPGANDLINGNVMIRLLAAGINPCQGLNEDTLLLTIQQAARINNFTSGTTFCSSSTIVLSASAQYYSSLQWTTGGDGFFVTPNALSSIYIPGSNDLSSGIVNITLNALANAPCSAGATKSVQIQITAAPSISLSIPVSSCSNSIFPINASASGYQTLAWSSSGNGVFVDPFSAKTKYTPGSSDISSGSVTLTLIALGNSPCNSFSANATTIIRPNPTVNVGADQSICLNSNVPVSAVATNFATLTWTSDGDGTFMNATATNTIYLPGAGDYADGIVNLFIVADGVAPCSSVATDVKTINFITPATAAAGINMDIVAGQQAMLNGFTMHASSSYWTTAGDGTFNNASLLNAIYTPGPADIASGSVTLGLVAVSILPCASSATDYFEVNIFPNGLLALKVFFEGYYILGSMKPVLLNAGISTNGTITDFYRIKLHDTIPPYPVVFTDSIPVGIDGLSFISLPGNVVGKRYYISIQHRNSIEIWSKHPFKTSAFGLYDFSVGGSQVYGN